jgi:hypothetical protein
MLKRTLLLALAVLVCAGMIGCKWGEKKQDEGAAEPMMMEHADEGGTMDTGTGSNWGAATMENIERGEAVE